MSSIPELKEMCSTFSFDNLFSLIEMLIYIFLYKRIEKCGYRIYLIRGIFTEASVFNIIIMFCVLFICSYLCFIWNYIVSLCLYNCVLFGLLFFFVFFL